MFFPEKVPFVIARLFTRRQQKKGKSFVFLYALDFCHVELREYIRQTSCTQLMRLYFSRISTRFSTQHMNLKNVDLRRFAFKVLKDLERNDKELKKARKDLSKWNETLLVTQRLHEQMRLNISSLLSNR